MNILKKDSRFLLDLYTLTFDENESVDGIATCTAHLADNVKNSLQIVFLLFLNPYDQARVLLNKRRGGVRFYVLCDQ